MPSGGTPTRLHHSSSNGVHLSPRLAQPANNAASSTVSASSPTQPHSTRAGASMGGITLDEVALWDENEVTSWLQSVRLAAHSATFARNDIAGIILFDVDNGFLKEMGISSVGDRIRITSAIKSLKKKCLETEATNRQRSYALGHNDAANGEMEWVDSNETSVGGGSGIGGRETNYANGTLRSSPLHQGHSLTHPSANHTSAISPSIGGRGTPTLRDIRGMGPPGGWTINRTRGSIGTEGSHGSSPGGTLSRSANAYASLTRPSTTAGGGSYGFNSASDSPTNAAFFTPRPSTSDDSRAGLSGSMGVADGSAALSPISEGSHLSRSSHPGSAGLRTFVHGGAPQQALALEDVKKKTIKFIGEDGTTKIVPVADCRDAFDVLARVLRKFGRPASGNSYTPTAGQTLLHDDELLIDMEDGGEQWGIFATSHEGHTKYLTDNELLAICHAPQPRDPLRERGLLLRRISKGDDPTKRPTAKRSKLEYIFGVSQDRINANSGFSPPATHDASASVGHVTTEGKRMNRASTMSILSGLGVNAARSASTSSGKDAPTLRSPPSVSMIPKKARNFFGQRPPSELISSHLTDYFPATEKRVLERTARRSIYGRPSTSLRSKRDSTWSFAADLDAPPLPSKEMTDNAAPAILIGMDSSDPRHSSFSDYQAPAPLAPPMMGNPSSDEWTRSGGASSSTGAPSLRQSLVRPTSFRRTSGESSRSRQSLATKLRVARGLDEGASMMSRGDRSETASLLTVDEITQEVESRRESMNLAAAHSGWVVDEDGVPIPLQARTSNRGTLASSSADSARPGSTFALSEADDDDSELDQDLRSDSDVDVTQRPNADAPGEERDRHLGDPMARVSDDDDPSDGLETDDDYIDADEDEDLSDEDGNGEGGVYHSAAPGREPIKWIKGALIGAGSFGNVFLGMNAKNGLLMAVKQVELPSGDSHSDQRKKSMLEALEREIELLKTIQHENIVQYLDSYADGTHLNIFLEYVPGGSVAALLRNYGAFEEPLVRNFVKQILHGLNFLHSQDIVHRDIKGANILVDNKSCIKISDFGISKKTESGLYVTHRPSLQGSVFWMAPEVVKQTSYTRKADIWSLGCLVVEMISGTHPWANLNQMQALYQIGSHAKPALPDEISPEAIDFLNKTFELDHNMRPSAGELLQHPFITEEYTLPASSTSPSLDGPNGSLSATSAAASTMTTMSTMSASSTSAEDATGSAANASTARSGKSKGNANARKATKDAVAVDATTT